MRGGRGVRAAAVLAAALCAALASCTDGTDGSDGDDGPDDGAGSPRASSSGPETAGPATRPDRGPMVVVGHATAPPLELTRRRADAVVAGDRERVAGRRVVQTLRAVRRDPDAVAAVPLSAVDPTVVAATVAGVDPVRDAARSVDLTVVGDLMLTRGVPSAADALAPTSRRLASADLTVGNLESTLSTDGAPTQGDDSFGADPSVLGPLADAGFDALSLANNHTGDYGERALLQTLGAVDRSRIERFGAGRDGDDALRAARLTARGTRFAFLGFNAIGETPAATSGSPGAASVRMPPRTGPLSRTDLDRVLAAVRREQRRADVVVVLPHWGDQYTHAPVPAQREVGRALVAAGADLVVGGHPHWVQGAEAVTSPDGVEVPVVHSLGNFVFDMDFAEETMEGVVLEATFWGAELKALRFVPYRMDDATFAPRVLDGADGRAVLADLWSTSSGPWAPDGT